MEIDDSCTRSDGDDLYVSVRVQARAIRNELGGVRDGHLQVRTTAAPADGKANKAVTKLLAGAFGVAPSRIELRRGRTHRDKLFRIRGR
ncbi:MAG: DUF167 domain-containing protein [Woeseiaceae bacterium]